MRRYERGYQRDLSWHPLRDENKLIFAKEKKENKSVYNTISSHNEDKVMFYSWQSVIFEICDVRISVGGVEYEEEIEMFFWNFD